MIFRRIKCGNPIQMLTPAFPSQLFFICQVTTTAATSWSWNIIHHGAFRCHFIILLSFLILLNILMLMQICINCCHLNLSKVLFIILHSKYSISVSKEVNKCQWPVQHSHISTSFIFPWHTLPNLDQIYAISEVIILNNKQHQHQ